MPPPVLNKLYLLVWRTNYILRCEPNCTVIVGESPRIPITAWHSTIGSPHRYVFCEVLPTMLHANMHEKIVWRLAFKDLDTKSGFVAVCMHVGAALLSFGVPEPRRHVKEGRASSNSFGFVQPDTPPVLDEMDDCCDRLDQRAPSFPDNRYVLAAVGIEVVHHANAQPIMRSCVCVT